MFTLSAGIRRSFGHAQRSEPNPTGGPARHRPQGGDIISESGSDYFSEQRGGIISELGGGFPRNLHRAVNPDACIVKSRAKWQEVGDLLKGCDIIVGGLDHIGAKDELDAFCRRFMIPYIDMGMDVTPLPGTGGSLVSGQVVLSMPGEPCLRGLQLVTDERLKAEAQRYGVAGSRPQVVWPNGLLASTAVGLDHMFA